MTARKSERDQAMRDMQAQLGQMDRALKIELSKRHAAEAERDELRAVVEGRQLKPLFGVLGCMGDTEASLRNKVADLEDVIRAMNPKAENISDVFAYRELPEKLKVVEAERDEARAMLWKMTGEANQSRALADGRLAVMDAFTKLPRWRRLLAAWRGVLL